MKADWLLMKDVRDELTKLRSRLLERTGSHEVFEKLLVDAWEDMCEAVEEERALNGGNRVRSLRTPSALKPDVQFTREMSARNYVGRPKWDILVDRVLRARIAEWSKFPERQIEPKVREFRAKVVAVLEENMEELVRKQDSPPSSEPSS